MICADGHLHPSRAAAEECDKKHTHPSCPACGYRRDTKENQSLCFVCGHKYEPKKN